MSMEITTESAKKAQKEAEWAYNKAMEKFYYSMLAVSYTHLRAQRDATLSRMPSSA